MSNLGEDFYEDNDWGWAETTPVNTGDDLDDPFDEAPEEAEDIRYAEMLRQLEEFAAAWERAADASGSGPD